MTTSLRHLVLACFLIGGCTELATGTAADAGPDGETGGSGGMTGGSGGSGGSGGTGGGGGSGGGSGDPCDDAGCDAHATCSVVEGEARCACTPPYEGTGTSCTLVEPDECEGHDCEPHESCIAGPTCVPTCSIDDSCDVGEACLEATDCEGPCTDDVCRPECASANGCGDGQECVDDDDCASGNCSRDESAALLGVCRPTCAIAGCQTAEVCTRGADCAEGVCTGGLCQPSCGSTCNPGDACATSINCAGDDICDELGHVCLTSCSDPADDTFTLASEADFTNARFCWEIDDNLDITTNFATVTADHLPYLQEVTGSLSLLGGSLIEITLPRLERVNGTFGAGNTPVERIFLPELTQVGVFGGSTTHGFAVSLSVATEVHAPKLETIYGYLQLQGAPNLVTARFDSLATINGSLTVGAAPELTTLDLPSLDARSDITGSITLEALPKLAWSTFTGFILPLNGNETVSDVGCDTASPCNCGNTSCVPE